VDIFVQELVTRTADCLVTLMRRTPLDRAIELDGSIILEDGSPVVWFTFPGAWHDIGLFHTADGRFTGTYANILTPVQFIDSLTWQTTDLFLDVWIDPRGNTRILDREELEAALAEDSITGIMADRADAEARRLIGLAATGEWPPAIVDDWPLSRAIDQAGSG